jgi:hypothetical protein
LAYTSIPWPGAPGPWKATTISRPPASIPTAGTATPVVGLSLTTKSGPSGFACALKRRARIAGCPKPAEKSTHATRARPSASTAIRGWRWSLAMVESTTNSGARALPAALNTRAKIP